MEQLKSAHRPFKVQNASVNSLTNGCDYYRIRVSSDKKVAAATTTHCMISNGCSPIIVRICWMESGTLTSKNLY